MIYNKDMCKKRIPPRMWYIIITSFICGVSMIFVNEPSLWLGVDLTRGAGIVLALQSIILGLSSYDKNYKVKRLSISNISLIWTLILLTELHQEGYIFSTQSLLIATLVGYIIVEAYLGRYWR